MPSLPDLLANTPYLNYLYSYPHKTAYRLLDEAKPLQQVWQDEDKSALFLYLHIPFCEMRCGFCNLFTTANPQNDMVAAYLNQLEKQAKQTQQALGDFSIANIAIGGGTPTYLNANELQRLFNLMQQTLGADLAHTPIGIETSPATVTEDRLQVLKDNHTNRISIGIESFTVSEAKAMGRPQKQKDVETALNLIQQADFDTLNIDLIYGGEGQSLASWLDSVAQAIDWQAEEIYLYPLYVRPLTGLGRKGAQQWDDQRMDAYLAATELLTAKGYTQHSMRMFRKHDHQLIDQGEYHCQEDGMIGLGCGARSYTRKLHYSSDYAVKRQGVLDIIQRYNQLDEAALAQVNYGIVLDQDEQQRRYVLLSLLQCEGMNRLAYKQHFSADVLSHFPQLIELETQGIATINEESIILNQRGIAYSDAIGTWLFSDKVRHLMEDYTCR